MACGPLRRIRLPAHALDVYRKARGDQLRRQALGVSETAVVPSNDANGLVWSV